MLDNTTWKTILKIIETLRTKYRITWKTIRRMYSISFKSSPASPPDVPSYISYNSWMIGCKIRHILLLDGLTSTENRPTVENYTEVGDVTDMEEILSWLSTNPEHSRLFVLRRRFSSFHTGVQAALAAVQRTHTCHNRNMQKPLTSDERGGDMHYGGSFSL